MIVIGTVIGSGFASGKEIAVFFSRFGIVSHFFIALTFFAFFAIIYAFFSLGEKALKKLEKSRFFSIICIIISLIFTSSMFAGTINVLPESVFLKICFALILLVVCCRVSKRGVPMLAKLNNLLIPATLVCLLIVLISNFKGANLSVNINQNAFAGLFFAVLYWVLNFSISGLVIAKTGLEMTKRQKVLASFFSSLILSAFLLLTNFVILSNPESMQQGMPLVFLSSGVMSVLIKFVVFSGCITTLFSLVFTTAETLKRFNFSQRAIYFVSIIFPAALSLFGFGAIVSLLYPFASVLGFFLLLVLFFSPQKNSS